MHVTICSIKRDESVPTSNGFVGFDIDESEAVVEEHPEGPGFGGGGDFGPVTEDVLVEAVVGEVLVFPGYCDLQNSQTWLDFFYFYFYFYFYFFF